jgi:DNA-binding PadR family transcriptional regulator
LNVPDGALGSHLQKLEEEGYAVKKEFVGKKSRSTYRLLPLGRAAFAKHLKNLKSIIEAVDS